MGKMCPPDRPPELFLDEPRDGEALFTPLRGNGRRVDHFPRNTTPRRRETHPIVPQSAIFALKRHPITPAPGTPKGPSGHDIGFSCIGPGAASFPAARRSMKPPSFAGCNQPPPPDAANPQSPIFNFQFSISNFQSPIPNLPSQVIQRTRDLPPHRPRQLRIDLRRPHIRVPQQLLDRADIHPS